ncbi:MAG: aerotolerance protein BatA [Parcubacteria bacterium C7867-003]|nr:MAG: aerotolerance protein BatA [Parcubacteria bacterium C7867-003]
MSWSARRRLIYGGAALLVLLLIGGIIFRQFFYRAPSCNDGFRNGDEKGVDCGGSCKNLCTSEALSPIVLWSKIFNISGDVYSAVAYVENPNVNSKNESAKYQFKIYDDAGVLLTVVDGTTSIPRGKKFAIFENGIILKDGKPKTADMEFLSFSPWQKDTKVEPNVLLTYGSLTSTGTVPRITGTVTNDSTETIPSLELAVFVLDGNENVVAASRSFVDNLVKRSTQDFVFTWPKPFDLGVETCVAPLDIVLALDKSGSMRSEGLFPPEPFTTVTKTAKNFIKNLTNNDQVSVVSFGTLSRQESQLTRDKDVALLAVENLFLSTTTQEQTNITGGLSNSLEEIKSSRAQSNSKKVIILLTDGIPTEPTLVGEPDYPISSAQSVATDIKSSGIDLFTVGLGKNVSDGFLKSLSTSDKHYFFAPSKETLSGIYSEIASSLCQKKPNVINVIYRTLN